MNIFERVRGMVRKGDPMTSVLAADGVKRKASGLHESVTTAIFDNGHGMTDQELEDLPQFAGYAYSTVRKRRTELAQAELLVPVGTRTNNRRQKMIVWDLAGRHEPTQIELPL